VGIIDWQSIQQCVSVKIRLLAKRNNVYVFREHEISNVCRSFVLVVPCIVDLFYVSNQIDAVLSSLIIVPQNHSTCFTCPLHPSSGVHKNVVTTTGTSHVYR
jgi:urea transporter